MTVNSRVIPVVATVSIACLAWDALPSERLRSAISADRLRIPRLSLPDRGSGGAVGPPKQPRCSGRGLQHSQRDLRLPTGLPKDKDTATATSGGGQCGGPVDAPDPVSTPDRYQHYGVLFAGGCSPDDLAPTAPGGDYLPEYPDGAARRAGSDSRRAPDV